MSVTFKNVLDRTYLTLINDYHLDNLATIDEEAFYTFLGGFLVNSIDMFHECLTDLSYHEETTEETDEETGETVEVTEYVFDQELTSKEIYILCLGVALGWYKRELDDVTQFKLHMSNKNFKTHSEQQNLQRRLERLTVMEENFDREITKYQMENLSKLPFFGGGS